MKNITLKILLILILTEIFYAQQEVNIHWPTLLNSDWPMIKHDPQFTGRSLHKGPQTPTLSFAIDMPHGIFSGPVLGKDNNLLFGSYFIYSDYFYSYNSGGSFLWEYNAGTGRPPQSGILVDSNGTIYFGCRDSNIYALNSQGFLKWKYKTSASITQEVIPNIDLKNNIYITNLGGELYSISSSGEINWRKLFDSGFSGKSPVFSPDGNTIYIAGSDSNLYALNPDGNTKWKFNCGVIPTAPMVDSEGNIYFVPTELTQYFYSLKPEGSIRWKFKLGLGNYVRSIPTIDFAGNLYIIARDTACCPYYWSLVSLDYDGEFRWKYIFNDAETDDFWQPLICDSGGTIYVGSTFGHYYYAISSTGQLKWKLPLNDYQVDNTGAIAEDGTLYLGVHKSSLVTNLTKTLIAIRDTGTVSVDENNFKVMNFALFQNHPNPFNPSTTIRYALPSESDVTITIFDVTGKVIRTMNLNNQAAGFRSALWDGKNDLGESVSSGVYICSFKAVSLEGNGASFTKSNKLMLLK